APASERKYDASVRTTVTSTPAPSAFKKTATLDLIAPNDEVERRGASPASNEGTLSQSSTPSLAHRRRDPRSLQPFVRCHPTKLRPCAPKPILVHLLQYRQASPAPAPISSAPPNMDKRDAERGEPD